MKHSREKLIRQKANELLQRNGVEQAPVEVEQIARSLGVEIRGSPTNDEISGFLLRLPGSHAVIGVNTLHHPNRQRFTIGHELGHFLLHEHDHVHVDRSVLRLRNTPSLRLRNTASSKGEDTEEIEANRFAAELLMPQGFLERDLKEFSITDLHDDRGMQQLAKRYKVSVQAMTTRLGSLGYITEQQRG